MTNFCTDRLLPQPPAAVYAAFTDAERLARWWGPVGFRNEFQRCELWPGGAWQFTMVGPDGRRYPNQAQVLALEPGRLLRVRHSVAPLFTLTLTLQPEGEGTRLHWVQAFDDPAVAAQVRAIVEPANEQNLDRLAAELAAPPRLALTLETRVRAPLALVWQAWTTPAHIVQWNSASPDWHTTHADVDLRVGGKHSARMAARDGSMAFDFEGTYTAVQPQALLESQLGERRLRVAFIPGEDGVTTVRETFDTEPSHSLAQQQTGWQAILDNFARHVSGLV